jgi:hypothetical protein
MKEKLVEILKEANIDKEVAAQLSEGISAAFDGWVKKQADLKELEDKETFDLVKESLDKVKGQAANQLKEAKEDFQKRLNLAREGVKKLIEEDYKLHKQELAQKVKLFVESKWQEAEKIIREHVEKEIKEDVKAKKTEQLSEAISNFVNGETKPIIKEVIDTKKVNELTAKVNSLIKENAQIKADNKQLQEKLQRTVNKPLIRQVNESKIGKVLERKEAEVNKEENSPFLNEILYLANYNRRS